MKWFFDMNNPVMRTLSTLADIVILNLLTLLCSLPFYLNATLLDGVFQKIENNTQK